MRLVQAPTKWILAVEAIVACENGGRVSGNQVKRLQA
jgi:hypothetical protein